MKYGLYTTHLFFYYNWNMNIIIVGAGAVGQYIASLLSRQNHNVVLIDKDEKKIEEASWQIDIGVRPGSGTNWQLLDDLLELKPDFFLAMTDSDETNLVACSIAKNLGYPITIARVKDSRYLNRTRLDFARLFDVDYFIGPELLVASEIYKHMMSPGSIALENFAHGAVQMRTLLVPSKWRKSTVPLSHLDLPKGVIVGLIRRRVDPSNANERKELKKIIFPHGSDTIKEDDEVTLIGETDQIAHIHQFFGIDASPVNSIVISGGSLVGVNLARTLGEKGFNIRLIEKDAHLASKLAEQLPHCTIINGDATDLNFLLSEKIGRAGLFAACTNNDETNILSSLLAKKSGCSYVTAVLTNNNFVPLVNEMGINHVFSPQVSAANRILSLATPGRITSLISLYDNAVEILEINVSADSKIIGVPLSDLGPLMPKEFLFAVIQNRGRIMIANGTRIISPGDTIIFITDPKHLQELEKIF